MEQINLTPDVPVGAVVAEYPATMRMLESLGIDYCCGGKQTLEDAATGAQMSAEALLAVLRTTIAQARQVPSAEPDWYSADLDKLIDHIISVHHSFMRRELPRTEQLLAKVVNAHGARHGDVLTPLAEAFRALRTELEGHLSDEENNIFPMIKQLMTGHVDAQVLAGVSNLEHEHEVAGQALARLREVTDDYKVPADACTTYCALYDALQALERDLHQHIHLENNITFPRVRQLLAAQQGS